MSTTMPNAQNITRKWYVIQLIEATLVDEDGRPRTEHGQHPSEPVSYTHLDVYKRQI